MEIKPIYQMTEEEFERTFPETLTTEEENEIVEQCFQVEAPKYIERYEELTGVVYEVEELREIIAEITSYGGREWAELTHKTSEEEYYIRPI